MQTVRYIVYILLCLSLFGLGGCPGKARNAQEPTKKLTGELQMSDYHFTLTAKDGKVWTVNAKTIHAKAATQNNSMTLDQVTATLREKGRVILEATADHGKATVIKKNSQMTLFGNVRAHEIEHDVLLIADRYQWSSNSDMITAEHVHWIGYGFDHQATRGIFNASLSHAEFTGNIETQSFGTVEAHGRTL